MPFLSTLPQRQRHERLLQASRERSSLWPFPHLWLMIRWIIIHSGLMPYL